jgi:hypothetical protein
MSKANTSQNICEHGSLIIMCDRCEKNKRIAELEATERQLREAVKVLAKDLRSYIMDQAVGDWAADISDEVACNPIAAAAVREASK